MWLCGVCFSLTLPVFLAVFQRCLNLVTRIFPVSKHPMIYEFPGNRAREGERENEAQIVWNVNNWRLFQCLCCLLLGARFSKKCSSSFVFVAVFYRFVGIFSNFERTRMHARFHSHSHAHINIVMMIFRVSFCEKFDSVWSALARSHRIIKWLSISGVSRCCCCFYKCYFK